MTRPPARIEKDVDGYETRYVYDGGNVITEYDGNNNLTRKYSHGPRIDTAWKETKSNGSI
ncbi:MAG: hypothetical protein RQ760_19280 [Sedimentisphaerales bacterium]|nr:hypothetical protein [Sedimentisphaerales bacterium]